MKNFENKIALVTGAASGIGKALAIELAGQGTHVVLADVNEPGMEDTCGTIEGIGRKALAIRTDVSKAEEVKNLCERATHEMGEIDILANVAGIGIFADIKDMDLEGWKRILGVNLYGPLHTITFLLDRMIRRRSGHIANVASGTGLIAVPGMGAYSVTKFGLVGLSEILRAEVSMHGIGVTAICPGPVRTNIFNTTQYINYDIARPLDSVLKYTAWSPERMARAIVKGIRKNRPLLALGAVTGYGYYLKRIFPSLAYLQQKAMAGTLARYKAGAFR